MSPRDAALRRQVIALFDGGGAHPRAREVLRSFPARRCGERPPGAAHCAWELVEHLRRAQRDILDFCRRAEYREPEWPEAYWPKGAHPPRPRSWSRAVLGFLRDLETCKRLARNPKIDLLAELPHQEGVTWLEELFLVADHNAWHLGQIAQLRRLLEHRQAPPPRRISAKIRS